MVKYCALNRSIPNNIDTDTEICTSLKSEFYFRFRWPRSTKFTVISYNSVGVFVTIRGKICPPQSRNCQNRILHISKIGNLLPVCPRNNSVRSNHISERREKFGKNRWRIADVIVRQPIGGQTHTRTDRNQSDCLSNAILTDYTSTIVFYRTRVYQMQPRNDQNWHASVGKYVHYNRKTAKIGFFTSLKSVSILGFVDTRGKVNAD